MQNIKLSMLKNFPGTFLYLLATDGLVGLIWPLLDDLVFLGAKLTGLTHS